MSSFPPFPISSIKVRIPPRRRETILRSRLIDLLYEQLDKSVLFVIAPAGYGKTSLLVDFAGQVELPVCWLTLDTLDQDPQRFLRYLIAAIAEKFPAFGRDSLGILENMISLETDQEQILVTITNEISARVRDHFVLVLDDYHFVESAPVIGLIVGRLLQLAGENFHLVISSRNLPDFPASPLLIARNQVGGISFKDISFQPQEIQDLYLQNKGIELSLQDAETVLKETEGWIAAIHLTNRPLEPLPQFHPLISTSVLFDFFAREVMDRQPEPVRQFMLLTSMLDAFDVSLCEEVLAPLVPGEKLDWAALFRRVQSTNLFSVPLDSNGQWMRYHHLFQHYLKSEMRYKDPALTWNIQRNLARAYEVQQKWEEAFQIYDQLDDHKNLARLLTETGIAFIGAGRILTLATWLKKLPTEILYSQPALISLLGAVHSTQGDQRQALNLLNRAEGGFQRSESNVHWVTTLVRRAEVYRQLGQYNAALTDVDQILKMTRVSSKPEFQTIHAEAERIKGLAFFGQGRVRDSLPWLESSLQRYQRLGLRNQVPILETELGVVHRRLGEPQIAAQYYASALEILEQTGNTGWKARLLNNMGMLKYMTGRLEEAHRLLQESIQTAKQCGYVRIQTNALISLGDLCTDLNDMDSAFACYDQALTQATQLGHSMYIFYASLGEARLKRMHGNSLPALTDLRLVELSQVHLGSFERAQFNLERGLCLLDLDRVTEAVAIFKEAVTLFEVGGNQSEQLIAGFWYEVATSLSASKPSGMDLVDLLPPQRDWRTPTPFMIHAGRAARWLKAKGQTQLLRFPSLRLFFEHAVRLLDTLPELLKRFPEPASNPNSPLPRLEIVTFGKVSVCHDGRVVEISDWQTREARDLFFYLLQSPPRTKEQIAMEFWPDLSPARIKMRFKINIYRIRQTLGQDVILFKDDQYSFNRSIPYVWDREQVDSLHAASRQMTNLGERMQTLEEATSLIQGRYLADLNAEWAETDRIRWDERQRELMFELAELYLRKERGQDCLRLARELLALDPLQESAHRLVLQAHAILHDPAGLALQYRQYQEIIENELGMLPSLEMRTLYERLLTSI